MTLAAERYPFSTRFADAVDGIPYPFLPLTLARGNQIVAVRGLLDTGAAVSVLPYDLGLQLGAVWDEQTVGVALAGNLAPQEARGLLVSATVANFPPVPLPSTRTSYFSAPLIAQ